MKLIWYNATASSTRQRSTAQAMLLPLMLSMAASAVTTDHQTFIASQVITDALVQAEHANQLEPLHRTSAVLTCAVATFAIAEKGSHRLDFCQIACRYIERSPQRL